MSDMENFKTKTKKTMKENRVTLEHKHREKMEYFEKLQNVILPRKKKELENIYNKKKEILVKNSSFKNILLSKMNIKIEQLERVIDEIIHKKEENEYVLHTINILNMYEKKGGNKELYDEYMNIIEEQNCIHDEDANTTHKRYRLKEICCNFCGSQNTIDYMGDTICKDCACVERCLESDVGLSYKELQETDLTPKFVYKRINHFNEILSQIQGKENTEIPKEVYDLLTVEIKKYRLNKSNLNKKIIRDFLKKLKLNKYYEHIPYILNALVGYPVPKIDKEIEDELRALFFVIQGPYDKFKPNNRKSFLSYPYTFRKLCELLELDHLLVLFPLLKRREKLCEQDHIWEKICKELEWQFIPSI